MGSLIKWILGGIAALVLLIIIVMISLPLFIDPNDYKDKITEAVQKQTGRELSIPGDIKLSVSPALKAVFKLGDVSMSSSKDFPETDFFSSKLVEINLALWPLISNKTLQINNIALKGVNVNLVRNSSGKTNWEDLAAGKKEKTDATKEAPVEQEQPEAKPAKALPKIDIGGVTIADINVTFSDQQAGRTVKLSNFNLNVGGITGGAPFPVVDGITVFDTDLTMTDKEAGRTVKLSGFNLNTGRIQAGTSFPVNADFAISIDDGKKPLTATTGLKTNLTFDLAKLVFLIDQLKLQTDISGAPVPVKLLGLEMNAEANLGKSMVNISSLQVTMDDTTMKGTASITDLQKPSYKAALHINQLNLDKYKSDTKNAEAEDDTATGSASSPSQPVADEGKPGKQQPETAEAPLIPVDLLRGLTFDAEIKIDKLIAAKLLSTNILVKATGKDGLVQLQPFSADLYQGTITVNGDIDVRPKTPVMKLTKVLKGVELGPMFMDMKGKEEVKGTADINLQVTTRGNTKKELTRNSNGNMKLSLANGEIAKLKIIDTIRVAKQLYQGGSRESAPSGSKETKQSGRPTSFAALSASGTITNGVFTNKDLLAESELMKVTGKGTVNLNTEEIDYLLTIYLAKYLERDKETDLVELTDTPIPYRITGTFDKIDQSAALEELLKAEAVKLLSKELEKQFGGDSQDKVGEKKDSSGSPEDLINKGLKSLFGN